MARRRPVGAGLLEVRAPGLRAVARLLDADYPDTEGILSPPDGGLTVRVALGDLRAAVARLSAVVGQGAVLATAAAGTLRLTAADAERGDGEEILEADIAGAAPPVGFQLPLLQAGLEVLGDEGAAAILRVAEPGRPVLFEAEGQPDYAQALMPLALGWEAAGAEGDPGLDDMAREVLADD